jgi:2-desacetyl-2-hydroxyethyl bacteriochlorophyllide A dehydrogenase
VRGAVFHGPSDIRVEELSDPVPGPDEAVVRVRAAGICGGDLHEVRAGRQLYPIPYPRPAQGHELAGDVTATGTAVTGVAVGDRVAVMPMVSCGRCAACESGRFALCPELEHIGVARPGGFAELCVVPARNLYRLPAGVGYEEGALLDCTAVAVHAVHRVPIPAGASVAVLGTGAIGLAVAQLARVRGAARVTVVGTRPAPLELARRLGADTTVDLSAGDAVSPVADVVYETAGGADLLERSVAAAGPAAAIGLVGESFERQTLDVASAMARELSLAFVWSYGIWEGRPEYEEAIELADTGQVTLAPAVSHRYPLESIGEAFATALNRATTNAIKVLVEP